MAAISAFRSRFFARHSSSQKELHSSRAAVSLNPEMKFINSNKYIFWSFLRAKEKVKRVKEMIHR